VEDSGEIKVYYGAADTCLCVATANFDDLVNTALNRDGAHS
jgi:beta-1,4-mannooligosaccharide/beta-1,4-mannosyl-N-acetylglucosamine phosphorylase